MSDSKSAKITWPLIAIGAFLFIGGLVFFWPSLIKPFSFFEFWTTKGDFWEAVKGAWPWYAWGFGATFLSRVFSKTSLTQVIPTEMFVHGTVISIWAGVAEEIAFRWLFFFSAVVILQLFNWIFGGFMGLELIHWLYQYILCPVANFFTLGYLEPYLLNGYGWVIAAAVISSNGLFRNAHAYSGLLGFINSWFFGMYMHWVVFKYGILPAIFIHFLYNFIIFTLEAIASIFMNRHHRSRIQW